MAKRYFNTKEAAERHLEVRRKAAYKRIEKKGWKVVSDNSHVHQGFLWKREEKPFDETCVGKLLKSAHPEQECKDLVTESSLTNVSKWFIFLAITTDELIKDLLNFKSIDYEAEIEAVLNEELEQEKTNYEKRIDSGELTPMDSFEWALLDDIVLKIIDANSCTDEEKIILKDLTDEIDFLYKDKPEILEKIKLYL